MTLDEIILRLREIAAKLGDIPKAEIREVIEALYARAAPVPGTAGPDLADAARADFEDRITAFEEAVRGHRVLDVPEARDALRSIYRALRAEAALLTHKVITCGVAASHPDPALSRRSKDYGGKWDSPQAEEVRKLRAERDDLARRLASPAPARTEEALREALRKIQDRAQGAAGYEVEGALYDCGEIARDALEAAALSAATQCQTPTVRKDPNGDS